MSADSPTAKARRHGTLRSRILKFFEDNPDEVLSRADMLQKFITSVGNLDNLLRALKAEGILVKPNTYSLAPAHHPKQPDSAA